MSGGTFGTEMQQRLQALSDDNVPFFRATPGACLAGRFLSTDDPDRLGWPLIMRRLERDGVFGFRMLSPEREAEIRSRVEAASFRLDIWGVFAAGKDVAWPRCRAVTERGLPPGFSLLSPARLAAETRAVQGFMADAGVVPFSARMLGGELGPSALVAIADATGAIAATAFAYMPHNAFSPYRDWGWGGLVAVGQGHRGKGLGAIVNAEMICRCFATMPATTMYEIIGLGNQPSRGMAAACGLELLDLTCGIAVRAKGARFTAEPLR